MNEKITFGLHLLYKTFIMQTRIDDNNITLLNKYLDSLMVSKERKSFAHMLVGQIRQQKKSQQLLMDHNHPDCKIFTNLCLISALEYMKKFYEIQSTDLDIENQQERIPQINNMWSVHSFEGDYNTIHTHGCKTVMGISIVAWTKVPKQIRDLPEMGSLKNASGSKDGFLEFVVGDNDVRDGEQLKFSGYTSIKPEVGVMYIFPSWVQHLVWPFFGEGERRSISANVNMFPLSQLSPKAQERYKKGYWTT